MRHIALALALSLAAGMHVGAGARAEWRSGEQRDVPLEGGGHTWLVRATVNGRHEGLFVLDTGASVCVLDPGLAKRANAIATGEEVELKTANGSIRVPLVLLRTVDVGGHRARDVMAVVHTVEGVPGNGVIGLSYLNNFKYSVDPRRSVLRLD
jgi:clan AA aspartic protease (TIGR02281 family)